MDREIARLKQKLKHRKPEQRKQQRRHHDVQRTAERSDLSAFSTNIGSDGIVAARKRQKSGPNKMPATSVATDGQKIKRSRSVSRLSASSVTTPQPLSHGAPAANPKSKAKASRMRFT